VVAGDSSAAFEFVLVVAAKSARDRGTHHRGRVPTTTQSNYFANTIDDGDNWRVVTMTLLGSPPVAWLIWNLVMFLEF
jgi:hypothetical protein